MRIRSRVVLFFMPILISALLITGTISYYNARSGMTRLSMKLMAFKAEELKKYAESQWKLLDEYNFQNNPEFVQASTLAIQMFASSIIRSDSERIVALDEELTSVLSTDIEPISDEEREYFGNLLESKYNGWIETNFRGADSIGHVFYSPSLKWLFIILEERSIFFAEIRQSTLQSVVVMASAVAISIAVLLVFSVHITRPISVISGAMNDVIETKNLSKRVEVETPDEIGGLATKFNTMVGEVEYAYEHAKEFAFMEAAARKAMIQREYEALTVLGKAAEYRDPETHAHISRVGLYSRLIAAGLGENEQTQELLYYAAPLHDIGKLGIPDSILLKPGKLTPEEFDIIKTHTTIAEEILKGAKSPFLSAGATIARTHHEHYDGHGYPAGLSGEAIPLFGRIVAVVDVFDALTSHRPYKPAWPFEKAFGHLDEQKGLHFDPRIVGSFLDRRDKVLSIYREHRDRDSI